MTVELYCAGYDMLFGSVLNVQCNYCLRLCHEELQAALNLNDFRVL